MQILISPMQATMSTSTSNPRAPAQPKMEFQFVNSTPLNPSVPQDLAVRALIRKQAMKKASAARRQDGNYGKHNLRQYPVFVLDEKIGCEEPGVKVIGNEFGGRKVENGTANREKKGDGVNEGESYTANTRRQLEYHSSNPKHKLKIPHYIAEDKSKEKERSLILTGREKQRWHIKMEPLSYNPTVPPTIFSPTSYELMLSKFGFDILELSTLATLHVGRATRRALCKSPESIMHQMRTQKQWSFLSFLPSMSLPISTWVSCTLSRITT